jgi:hypothetical protein
MVADWHALTTGYADTSRIKENSLEVALDGWPLGRSKGRDFSVARSGACGVALLHHDYAWDGWSGFHIQRAADNIRDRT